MSVSQRNTLKSNVALIMKEISSVRVEGANLKRDLNESTALMPRMKDDVAESLSKLYIEIQKTFIDMFVAVNPKIQPDVIDGCNEMETQF